MSNIKKLMMTAAGGEALNVEDVFSTYLYEGNSSTLTVNNGIDLDGEGGLVWIKNRDNAQDHMLVDTERGGTKYLNSNTTTQEQTFYAGPPDESFSFSSTGFSSTAADFKWNNSQYDYASWTFRKAPKFFDVVTYTGNGSSGRTVSHNLGSVPGCIFIKRTSSTEDWVVYHVGADATAPEDYYFKLNTTANRIDSTAAFNDTAPTSTEFTVGNNGDVNASSETYVAYLFAHNDGDGEFGPTGDQDIIKCGSYTGNGSSQDIDLGFEPQWVLFKNSSYNDSFGISHWSIYDNMRGVIVGGDDTHLRPNTSDAEQTQNDELKFTATGFSPQLGIRTLNASGDEYIYIAIRRGPMAVPESATDVFDVRAGFTGTDRPQFPSGFVTDMGLLLRTSGANPRTSARLIQGKMLKTNLTDAETAQSNYVFDYQNGWLDSGLDTSYYGYSWKRAPNYFDVVCYDGDATASPNSRDIEHNLGVAPEMMWIKCRSFGENWAVYHSGIGATKYLSLNGTAAAGTSANWWRNTAPTDTVFTIGHQDDVNANGETHIAYLFASLDGVSKVGSYTGTGASLNIDCGFSSGARFVLIKRTDNVGGWYVWDSERGIVAGNDPFLFLNDTQAEFTNYDALDPYSAGFTVNPVLLGINALNSTYIFYAIA